MTRGIRSGTSGCQNEGGGRVHRPMSVQPVGLMVSPPAGHLPPVTDQGRSAIGMCLLGNGLLFRAVGGGWSVFLLVGMLGIAITFFGLGLFVAGSAVCRGPGVFGRGTIGGLLLLLGAAPGLVYTPRRYRGLRWGFYGSTRST